MYSPSSIDDKVKVTGHLVFHLVREDGSEQFFEFDNLVTTLGKGVIADRMKPTPVANAMTHVSVGTTATAPTVGDTQLAAEVAGSRTALTNTTSAGAVVTYTSTLGPGIGTGALVEAGLFNAASAGTMLARTTYTVINKAAGDTLNVSWALTIN